MGLYMPGVCTPCASHVQSTTFCPRLSSRVNDSPHPKSFSPGARLKLGDHEAGVVTSSGYSPRLEIGIALGYAQRQATLMFNGYGDQVASLYNGMDLKKNF